MPSLFLFQRQSTITEIGGSDASVRLVINEVHIRSIRKDCYFTQMNRQRYFSRYMGYNRRF